MLVLSIDELKSLNLKLKIINISLNVRIIYIKVKDSRCNMTYNTMKLVCSKYLESCSLVWTPNIYGLILGKV